MRENCSTLKWYSVCALTALFLWIQSAGAMNLYVSPDGSDSWSGKLARPNSARTDGPLASLAGARDAIRRLKLVVSITEPLQVIVADGTYTLNEPFVLTPPDSG
ncbi:MAG TPA: hypothetical protein DIU00_09795, partial [Phycisphaerales bacterium]|nr:hypothetical protein [Phycisphaerales bacterium]